MHILILTMKLNSILDQFNEHIKLREMQYAQDQNGIARRYRREKKYWDDHFSSSKNFILESAKTKNKGTVIVLGSGWLFDLPIDELANQFKEIILYDIIHPKQVIQKIRKYDNVIIEKMDITGGLIDYFYTRTKDKSIISAEELSSYKLNIPNCDFVISLNIMCQLHIILIDYLKKFNIYTSKQLRIIEQEIQKSHMQILPKTKTCLITDYEEEIYDEDDALIGVNPLIEIDLPEGEFSKKWKWKFDTSMTYREDHKTYFNTLAIDF